MTVHILGSKISEMIQKRLKMVKHVIPKSILFDSECTLIWLRMGKDIGEDLLGSKEEKRRHRKYVKDMEKEWEEKKRRRIEEERKPQMGWSKPKSPEWSTVREGEDERYRPEGQMRTEGIWKRPKEETGRRR